MPVDFFIVGASKSGTTALDSCLRRHIALEMARVKEVHYFDNDSLDWSMPDRSALHDQFAFTPSRPVRGEATPIYLYWPNSLERLKQYNAQARIIVCLRHPSFRAFSHWRMAFKRGGESLPFAEAISDKGRERVRGAPGGVHRIFSYIERGLYSRQIERLFSLFGRAQILFLRTEELWIDPAATLARTHEFLGVAPQVHDRDGDYVVPLDSRDLGCLPEACRDPLMDLFLRDIERTASLTGLALNDWLEPAYAEPMGRRG